MLEFEIVRNPQAIADEINAIKEKTREAVISGAIEIGKRLCEAKEMLPVGSWCEWLKTNVDYSERTAQNLMSIYNEYGKKGIPDGLANASLTNALALVGLPEDIKHEVLDSGAAESLSTRELKAEIDRLKQERAEAQVTIDGLLAAQETLTQQKAASDSRAEEARRDEAEARENALKASEKALMENEKNLELTQENHSLRMKLEEAKQAVQIEPAVVEKVPDEVLKELAELRSLVKQSTSPSEILFRDAWSRIVDTYRTCVDLIEEISRGGCGDKATNFRNALQKGLRSMADKLG